MTSPLATLDAERIVYIVATLDGEPKKFDDIDCFQGEDLKLSFMVKNANGEEVDLTGATIELNISQSNLPNSLLLAKTVGAGITISGSSAVALFNSAATEIDGYKRLLLQLKITKTSKIVVASYGAVNVKGLIA